VIYRLQEAAVVEAAAQRITSQLQAISVTETTILRTIQGSHHLSWCVIPCYDKMHSSVNRSRSYIECTNSRYILWQKCRSEKQWRCSMFKQQLVTL
jgi:hypothetical protein